MDKENKNKNQISLGFVAIMALLITVMVCYAIVPSERLSKSKKKLTYEEKLALIKANQKNQNDYDDFYTYLRKSSSQKTNIKQEVKNTPEFTVLDINVNPVIKYGAPKKSNNEFYKELIKFPISNITDVQLAVDKINEHNGYPRGIVTVKERNSMTSGAKIPESYILGIFDAASGAVYINSNAINSLQPQILIPVIAHELDHFDKIIKICKSMGADNYIKLLRNYNVQGINEDFWRRNAGYADITGFDSKTYEEALKRLLDRSKVDSLSSYADFYKMSESIRNPLEISAYTVSDNLEKLYGIAKSEGIMRLLTKEFNKVDWAVYSMSEKDSVLKQERPAIFDYIFAKAVMNKYPDTKQIHENCVNNKNSDLSDFWIEYQKKLPGFYAKNGQTDANTFYILSDLLQNTESLSKYGLTSAQYTEALRQKVNTAKNNLAYIEHIDHLKRTAQNMLTYMFREKTLFPEDELNCFLILLAIENNIYVVNQGAITLYDLKIPEFIEKMYPTAGRKQKYNFIYNNYAFKEHCTKKRAADPSLSDQDILIELIKMNALNLKSE